MSAPQETIDAFKKQLKQHEEYGLPPSIVKTAEDLLKPPRLWKEQIMVDIYLAMFLDEHPHMQGARNLPTVRKAILVDLISKGIL